jgi:beta-galactosidase
MQNDSLFPPGPKAAPYVTFDGRGLIVKGKRAFLASGGIHYPRVPREQWRDSLLKLRRAGFNSLETYVFWNFHEAAEGVFDFATDRRDVGAFLDIANEVGLYAIIRVGPYVCAEWKNGGYPEWLLQMPGLKVRSDDPAYLDAVAAYFDGMLPIVSARQIHKGGNVVLVQLENEMPGEDWKFWGTESDGPHCDRLLELARSHGIEVPMFFSGMHHAHNPAPPEPIVSGDRQCPWLSMELWTTWFDVYGLDDEQLRKGERHPWRVLAQGGNGFNIYMFQGGTTFGFDNFDNDVKFGDEEEKGRACYDYGSPIGQTGNVGTFYRRMKRIGYFADTFSSILAGSDDASSRYRDYATGVATTARTSPDGTLIFLDNPTSEAVIATLKSGGCISLAPGEILACAIDVPLADGLAISEAATRILGIVRQGTVTSIICYGPAGDRGRIAFSMGPKDIRAERSVEFTFPETGVCEQPLRIEGAELRILAIGPETADRTWIVDGWSGKSIVIGTDFLGDYTETSDGRIVAGIEVPWSEAAATSIAIYRASGRIDAALKAEEARLPEAVAIAPWDQSLLSPPPSEDEGWLVLSDGEPPELGADIDETPYAWYRTGLKAASPVTSMAFARIGDRAVLFADGKEVGDYDLKRDPEPVVALHLPEGEHEILAFVSHSGRKKFNGETGDVHGLSAQKGLRGPVRFDDGSDAQTAPWAMRAVAAIDADRLVWQPPAPTGGAPCFYRTRFALPARPETGAVYRLALEGVSFGAVLLNGRNVGVYPEVVKDCPGIWLPSCWMIEGENTVIVFDERGQKPTSAAITVETGASRRTKTVSLAGTAPQ